MVTGSRASTKALFLECFFLSTGGFVIGVLTIIYVGRLLIPLDYRDALVIVVFFYPFMIFTTLYRFYKLLVRDHGLKGEQKLFSFM